MTNIFRTRQTNMRPVLSAIILILAGLFLAGCAKSKPKVSANNPNLAMGNPSNATADPSNKENYLISNQYFTLSYNSSKGTPNWVSWRLTKDDIGSAARVPFYPDTSLPRGFQVVTPSDYTGSGFDRGHMCPHSDRSANDTMSNATFVMTNMVPQSPPLNEQTWAELETYCRDLAQKGSVLYIIDGPYGKGGTGRNGYAETIGSSNTITVPSQCWKVIMVTNSDIGNNPAGVTADTRLIAVLMPNNMKLKKHWAGYRTSVARVEQLTGYKFFDKVPAAVIDPLKQKTDKERIPTSASPHYGRRSRGERPTTE